MNALLTSVPCPARARMPRGARARGYTVIEILMAMTVLAIGGAGVITMQKTSVASNADARKADVANSIARMWVERLRQDAMGWTTPNATNATSNLGSTKYLSGNVGSNPTQPAWFVPASMISPGDGTTTMSAGFDILGRDQPAASVSNANFCVNIALTWLDTTADMIRADVRVIWPVGIAVAPPSDYCAKAAQFDPNIAGATTNLVFHEIYLTTNLVENTAP